jgi:hypothetical protein
LARLRFSNNCPNGRPEEGLNSSNRNLPSSRFFSPWRGEIIFQTRLRKRHDYGLLLAIANIIKPIVPTAMARLKNHPLFGKAG